MNNTAIALFTRQSTASLAAASIFATDVILPCTSGEARECWVKYNTATVNTLRMSDDDGTVVASNAILRADSEGTTNITASHIAMFTLVLQGGNKYNFSQSSAGTVNTFVLYMLE